MYFFHIYSLNNNLRREINYFEEHFDKSVLHGFEVVSRCYYKLVPGVVRVGIFQYCNTEIFIVTYISYALYHLKY